MIQGGTSAGKTVAILMYLINLAQERENLTISVASETLPHIKRGARKDFLNIMEEHGSFKESRWNRTDNIYKFETGSTIEFFGVDSADKVRGPRRDILFINEANNVPYEAYDQMEVRTRELIILDFNPVSEFWVHTDVIPKQPHDFLKLTYRDNEALDPVIKQSIESRKGNENWWRIYGEGEIGLNEGQVYTHFQPIDSVPHDARILRRWLDFGYTNHPTAIGAVYKYNDGFVLDEEEYRTGMSNPDIAQKLKQLPYEKTLVIADSAEPKSIAEIRGFGLNVLGAVKGKDSITFGVQAVQDQTVFVTKRSTNLWKEVRNYLWKSDKDGKPLNVPEDLFNHHMDGIRYALSDLVGRPTPGIATYWKERASAQRGAVEVS